MSHLGAELADVSTERVVIRLPYRKQLTQQNGFFHAGAHQRQCGFSRRVRRARSSVLTVEFKINLRAPAQG